MVPNVVLTGCAFFDQTLRQKKTMLQSIVPSTVGVQATRSQWSSGHLRAMLDRQLQSL
jgi:hypothetical protein